LLVQGNGSLEIHPYAATFFEHTAKAYASLHVPFFTCPVISLRRPLQIAVHTFASVDHNPEFKTSNVIAISTRLVVQLHRPCWVGAGPNTVAQHFG